MKALIQVAEGAITEAADDRDGLPRRRVTDFAFHDRARFRRSGKSPGQWSCGWGYGRTTDGQSQRGGPSCQKGRTIVQGIEAKLRPFF